MSSNRAAVNRHVVHKACTATAFPSVGALTRKSCNWRPHLQAERWRSHSIASVGALTSKRWHFHFASTSLHALSLQVHVLALFFTFKCWRSHLQVSALSLANVGAFTSDGKCWLSLASFCALMQCSKC